MLLGVRSTSGQLPVTFRCTSGAGRCRERTAVQPVPHRAAAAPPPRAAPTTASQQRGGDAPSSRSPLFLPCGAARRAAAAARSELRWSGKCHRRVAAAARPLVVATRVVYTGRAELRLWASDSCLLARRAPRGHCRSHSLALPPAALWSPPGGLPPLLPLPPSLHSPTHATAASARFSFPSPHSPFSSHRMIFALCPFESNSNRRKDPLSLKNHVLL